MEIQTKKDKEISLVNNWGKCKICGFSNLSSVGEIKEFNNFFKQYYEQLQSSIIIQCSNCGFLSVSPEVQMTKDILNKLYNVDYFRSNNEIKSLKNLYEKRWFLKLAEKKISRNLKGLTFLDIGCGAGEYLKIGSEFGMDVTGYDVDSSIKEYISKKYGFNVVTGDLNENTFQAERFDVVVLSHVIEHLNDPGLMIRNINKFLKRDGVLILTMPNPNALVDRIVSFAKKITSREIGDNRLTPYKTPFHINGFSLKSTKLLLQKNGLKVKYLSIISGLSWADGKLAIVKKIIKIFGYIMGRGTAIICIAQK